MKNIKKLLVFVILVCLFLNACGGNTTPTDPKETTAPQNHETVDYASSVKLDMSNTTAKAEATVKSYIDGDTVHFNVSTDVSPDGILKARFLAVNTPESTGKIEEYGKAASNFTKEKLSAATSIILESEHSEWEKDSTGGRHLAWIWYKTDADSEYRNLNIELLQNGLALPNSSANNQYGSICMSAINQAKQEKLNIYSGQKDPGFYYGDAVELTLRELRANIENYNGIKVAFNGIVSSNSGSQGVYVEDYDSETGLYYGIYIYYGHGLSGAGLDILSVGNEVRIVGTVQYYEVGKSWQVSGLTYRMIQPDDPGNIQKLSEGHEGAYALTDPDTFANGQVTITTADGEKTIPYAEAVLGTTVQMQGLKVTDVYTTDNGGSSDGAMTLTCDANGVTISVRTALLVDENGNQITEDAYLGKTIDVKGIVDFFSDSYQIKVFSPKFITIIE